MPSSAKLESAIVEGPDTYTGVSKSTTILSTSPATPVLLILLWWQTLQLRNQRLNKHSSYRLVDSKCFNSCFMWTKINADGTSLYVYL